MHLNVALQVEEPDSATCAAQYRTLDANRACPITGPRNELLSMVLALCNISYTLHPIADDDVGSFQNGSFTRGLGRLANGSLDIWNIHWSVTETRLKHFNYGQYAKQSSLAFISRKADITHWQYAVRIFSGFTPMLYIAFIAVGVALLGLLGAMDIFVYGSKSSLVTIASGHGISTAGAKKMSKRMVIILIAFLSVHFSNLYQGALLTNLFTPPTTEVVTFDRLLKQLYNNEVTILVLSEDDYFYENLRTSIDTNYEKLRGAVKNNRVQVEINVSKALEMAETGKFIIKTYLRRGEYLIMEKCDLNVIPMDDFQKDWQTFMISKYSKVDLKAFRECQLELSSFDQHNDELYDRSLAQHADRYCGRTAGSSFEVQGLNVRNVFGCFVILGIGICLAICVLSHEILKPPCFQKFVKPPFFTADDFIAKNSKHTQTYASSETISNTFDFIVKNSKHTQTYASSETISNTLK